jgi:ATP-dependent RNA helicase DeaD
MSFQNLGLNNNLLKAIDEMGFKKPSPIQEQAIPVVLAGKDLIAQAHTGTGKTAAFGLPSLHNLTDKKEVQILVMTPTRELANQVSEELYAFGKIDGVKTATVYGGSSYKRQIEQIRRGAQVVVATPGRLLDLLSSKKVRDFNPSIVILDEADEMLDMGFSEDIHEIFKYLPKKRQTLLFSATMSNKIQSLSKNILHDPERITLVDNDARRVNDNIKELYCVIEENERDDAVFRILDVEDYDKVVIFCRTKREVDRLSTKMTGRGFAAKAIHGDIEQRNRERVISSFKKGEVDILVATDVAARGLDVNGISHVINFHIPFGSDSYVHRIGRTGRAGESGIAITLASTREWRDLSRIKKDVGDRMIHAEIPSRNTASEGKFGALLTEIKGQKIGEDALKFIEKYKDEMDHEDMLLKLLTSVLESKQVEGPDFIGVRGDKLRRFMQDLERKGGHGGGRSRRRGRSGGRRRSGGGRGGSRGRNRGRGGRSGGRGGSSLRGGNKSSNRG